MAGVPPPPPVKSEPGSFAWMEWYKTLYDYLNTAGSVLWSSINFTGSNLTDIVTRLHSSLQSILGTGSYHISAAEATQVTELLTQTGTGAFVRATSPTLVTPALGTPSALVLTNATGLPAAGVTGTALVSAAIGTTVQAYDADLTTWAGITPGTGVGTALAVNVGTAGAVVVNGGALGTPSSGTATNLTGTASGLTAGNVTTNANLTGPITSVGNASSIASQTGTGTKFVMDTAPTFASTIKVTTGASVGGATPGTGGLAFPATAVAVADVNTLDDYEEYTAASMACTGALTVSVIWKATKTGNHVTLTLPATSGTAAAASTIVYGVALPTDFRPAAALAFPVLVRDNGTNQTTPGMIIISTSGVITIYKDATGASFTNASTCGLAQSIGTGMSWTI